MVIVIEVLGNFLRGSEKFEKRIATYVSTENVDCKCLLVQISSRLTYWRLYVQVLLLGTVKLYIRVSTCPVCKERKYNEASHA